MFAIFPFSLREGEACIDDELLRMPACFSSLFRFQAIKYSSAGTDRSQSQADYPESLWIYEQEEMLSIGIEEVSETPEVLNHAAGMLPTPPPFWKLTSTQSTSPVTFTRVQKSGMGLSVDKM